MYLFPMGRILASKNCDQELIKDMWRYPATKMLASQHSVATLGIRKEHVQQGMALKETQVKLGKLHAG